MEAQRYPQDYDGIVSGGRQLWQAASAGYSPQLLEYCIREGRVERVARGIFRLTHFPPGEHEDLTVV